MRKLGIILAGGKSTRLFPNTLVTTKQLLPVYDKPMIYYPLSTLMLSGIRDVVIVSAPHEVDRFKQLFKNCKEELGMDISIVSQPTPAGVPDAFNIVQSVMGKDYTDKFQRHALILGDNIFYGAGFSDQLYAASINYTATIFAHTVKDPHRFGVIEVTGSGYVMSLEEKPEYPKSNLAVTGLYFYPPSVYDKVKTLTPSLRGELEITDLNKLYISDKNLTVTQLQRGMMWFDAGTPDSLLEASNFIRFIQEYQGILINSPHEIAIHKKWTSIDSIYPYVYEMRNSDYGSHLLTLLDNERKQN